MHYRHSRFDRSGMAANKRIPTKDMRYLVTMKAEPPFFTMWFEYENHYQDGMIVYDLFNSLYTTDGKTWEPVETDEL